MQHIPRKRFGQHFLADKAYLDRIVSAIDAAHGDQFVEIGPGEGVLTSRILSVVGNMRAIEIDRDLAARLRGAYGDKGLTLFEGDALKFDFSSLPEGMRVIGNLPYNISTPLIFHLCGFANRFRDMHFMLQKEVVERMAAKPSTGAYGRMSVMAQYWCDVEPLFVVPAGAFRPPPKVQSMMVRLRPHPPGYHGEADPLLLKQVVTAAFSHRRKTLRNSLSGLLSEERLVELGIDPGDRAENLGLVEYVRLSRYMDR